MNTNSQFKQDLKVIDLYKQKKNGFFVDIGASNGVTTSNTYLLEKNFGWKGICVEPIPSQFKLLCNNRPNSMCCNDAIFNVSNEYLDYSIAINNDLSGLTEHIDCHKHILRDSITVTVKTITLEDLLNKYNAPRFIEYLSIDTEGSEYKILENFNFDKYMFGLIHIEHNYIEPKRSLIKNLLISYGYKYIGENFVDDCYVHRSIL